MLKADDWNSKFYAALLEKQPKRAKRALEDKDPIAAMEMHCIDCQGGVLFRAHRCGSRECFIHPFTFKKEKAKLVKTRKSKTYL